MICQQVVWEQGKTGLAHVSYEDGDDGAVALHDPDVEVDSPVRHHRVNQQQHAVGNVLAHECCSTFRRQAGSGGQRGTRETVCKETVCKETVCKRPGIAAAEHRR